MSSLGMKAVGNGRENTITIFVTVFFSRKRERERKRRSGKRNRIYGMSETKLFDRERVDNGRESIIQIGKINANNHIKCATHRNIHNTQAIVM